MKLRLSLLLAFCSTMAIAQVTTEASVTTKINTFLPTNNVRAITASGLRSTLLMMTDLISRKVNNEQIIVSADGKSVKIKPAGTAAAYVPPKVELSLNNFQATADIPTIFTYQTKDVFKRQIKINISTASVDLLTGIDALVDFDGYYVYKDASNKVIHKSLNELTLSARTAFNETTGVLTANDFTCGSCTEKHFEVTVLYTKR